MTSRLVMTEASARQLLPLAEQGDNRAIGQLLRALVEGDFIGGTYTGSATWDAASIDDGNEVAQEVTVTGAALGDFAIASHGVDVADLVLDAKVTAADTVTAVLANNTGGAIDLASSTLRVVVIPKSRFGL